VKNGPDKFRTLQTPSKSLVAFYVRSFSDFSHGKLRNEERERERKEDGLKGGREIGFHSSRTHYKSRERERERGRDVFFFSLMENSVTLSFSL